MKKMYKLGDAMASPILIGSFDTLAEMKKYAREYDEECDGEWYPLFAKWNEKKGKYEEKEYHF